MPHFTDQIGRSIFLPQPPKRIISLVPSQTELLAHLGLEEEVLGITKFCVHPYIWWKSKTRIGGTKTVDIEKVLQLSPDLILANKEENVEAQVMELAESIPTYVSDVNNLPQALDMIRDIGLLTQRETQAEALVKDIRNGFKIITKPNEQIKVAYLIWQDPWMTVGGDTFINSMLKAAGFANVFADRLRYPEIDMEILKSMAPQVIMLSSEPFPFGAKHLTQLKPLFPATQIILVDGELFSWYGSRLKMAPPYLAQLQGQLTLKGKPL